MIKKPFNIIIAVFIGLLIIGGIIYFRTTQYQNTNIGKPESQESQNTATETDVSNVTPTSISEVTPTSIPKLTTITGIVANCQFTGSAVGISNASIRYANKTITTDDKGRFSITVPNDDPNPLLEISALGYITYSERVSRMVKGAFYLIPKEVYRGMDLVLWNNESSNPQNWHRKWERQTQFIIVKTGASEQQINTILSLLATDEYRKMTGGRYTSSIQPTIVEQKPTGADREGKTVISFAPGIISGGIAHSEDRNGVIYYSEITWDTNQAVDKVIFWHEMFHTVTAGGHINEWPSVVSEVNANGNVTEMDEKILNCIYNSPPKRTKPNL
jgi:hypothetical protein